MADLSLPSISLESLPPATRDWLLARAATDGVSPQEVLLQTLDRRAGLEGYGQHHDPRKTPQSTDIIRAASSASRTGLPQPEEFKVN